MGQLVQRPLGYTTYTQRLVWSLGDNVPVTAYLWGGGGGGGGNDSASGGAGGGGGFTQFNFVINNGDTLECAIGGGGGAGGSGRSQAAGGAGGAGYEYGLSFNLKQQPNPGINDYTNTNYCSFLNTNGVWVNPVTAASFDKSYTVNFPITGNYTFVGSCDNYGYVYLDGNEVLYMGGFTSTYTSYVRVTAGVHTIRVVATNTGGPGSVALTIGSVGSSYSGGNGGAAGPSGSSGGGGGGGGATVAFLNGTFIGVAAGGAGGGGGGNVGSATGQSAPGTSGNAADGVSAGMNGKNKSGDGGGGGGGGGGLGGGNGGNLRDGDQGGLAGGNGRSSAPFELPSGIIPGGTSNQYYTGRVGYGGAPAAPGAAGYAMFVFDVTGVSVHWGGAFAPVSKAYIKQSNDWKLVKSIYVKESGVWRLVNGGAVPAFGASPSSFGLNPRPYQQNQVCISVIDECSLSRDAIQSSWNSFLSLQPGSYFYLLQPGGPYQGDLKVPSNFTPSVNSFGPIAVNRDAGNPINASNWFSLCNLQLQPAGTAIYLAIDNSGSMTTSTVQASYDLFLQNCATAGLPVFIRTMSSENWPEPFISI